MPAWRSSARTSGILGFVRIDPAAPSLADRVVPDSVFDGAAPRIVHRDSELLIATPDTHDLPHHTTPQGFIATVGRIEAVTHTDLGGSDPDDPAVLWQLYARHGTSLTRHLDGHAVLVIRDGGDVHILQDRHAGIVNLFWLQEDGVVAFSDRLAPLLRVFPHRRRLDPEALYEYLLRSWLVAPRTGFAGVSRLAAGTALHVANGAATIVAVDAWRRTCDSPADPREALEAYRALLEEAIGGWVRRHPGSAFLLSGGLDSGVIVELAARLLDEPLTTVGIGAEGFTSDAPYARRIAAEIGARHVERTVDGSEIEDLPRIVSLLEMPCFEPGIMLTWCALGAVAGTGAPAAVGGETADQLFGACAAPADRYLAARRKLGPLLGAGEAIGRIIGRSPLTRGIVTLRKAENRILGFADPAGWCGNYGFRHCDLAGLFRHPPARSGPYEDLSLPAGGRESLFDVGCTVLNRDYALDGILMPTGRFADHFGVETFSPFLARRVTDFILGLPWELRLRPQPGRPGQFVYKALHRDLAYTLMPREVVDRPKQGGAVRNMIHLQDPGWRDLVRRALLASPVVAEHFRPAAVSSLFAAPAEHATRILALVTLDLWAGIFLDGYGKVDPETRLTEHLRSRAGT